MVVTAMRQVMTTMATMMMSAKMLVMRKIERENDDGDHGDETNSYDDYYNL